ncbi:zinc finger CCHC domain-containing protein 2 isoform X2 [Coregonus clupeaformis]|uniref:zinc finger CCHC domain-containing protein 2 isoform X2 n=1 Tax=Coregonus clupeaformis TaxID=59861 RepID=UPI001E1C471F|nr:zinc finger CCHC domain-containing protein 2 isoform X2 [Coregonus clupeaformis]
MLKMKLPIRIAEGDHTVEDEQENTDCNSYSIDSVPYCGVSHRFKRSTRESYRLSQIDKKAVFEWFGLHLSPAKRIEFMYGLLHMCQPLEIRFLGSCLEDLARKDVHVLRDFEITANCQTDLALLKDVADPVVRSKLLVYLSLLRSGNRECADTLYRALRNIDPALYLNTYHGVPLSPRGANTQNVPDQHCPCEVGMDSGSVVHPSATPLEAESGSLEHLALLFSMASLHPAFPFYQRDTVRHQLDNVERAIEEIMDSHKRTSVQQKQHALRREDLSPRSTDMGQSACCIPNQLPNRRSSQREVHIDKIVLKRISWNRVNSEYSIEVQWSDSTWTTVTKTHHELDDFLSKLPCERSTEPFEKGLVRLLAQGDQYEPRDLERTLQEMLLSAPAAFRQRGEVCRFLLPHCSHCKCLCPWLSLQGDNTVPPGKTWKAPEHFKEDCTEPSSQDQGAHPLGHQTTCSSKSLAQSTLLTKSSQRPAVHSEHNGVVERRREPGILSCRPDPHQNADEKWAFTPERMSRRRLDGRRSEGAKGYIIRPQSTHMTRQGVSKKPVQDRYGDTWSNSSSTPSSSQHEAHESLEDLEDERDTAESYSDHSVQEKRASDHSRGEVVATVPPIVPVPHKEEPSYTGSPLSVHPLPMTVQNGPTMPDGMVTVPPQPGNGSPAEGALTGTTPMVPQESISSQAPLGDPERQRHVSVSASLSSPQPTNASFSIHPMPQHYRTPTSPESRSTNPQHQPPISAISVIPLTFHMSPLMPAYTSTDPASTATLPLTASLPDSSTGPQALAAPTSLPTPTTVTPSSGATVTPAAIRQVQATLPPAVPTHTPGTVASPALTLTHSTAQGDGTSSCSSSGVAAGQTQQKPQPQQKAHPPQQQQMSCNTCGCRGSCGSSHSAAPNPNFYFPSQLGHQVFSATHFPLFHLPSMCSTGYPSHRSQVQRQSNGTTQLPFYPPPPHTANPTFTPPQYNSGPLLHTTHSHSDHMLATQPGYNLQQMAAAPFNRFYTPMFSSVGLRLGTGMKKSSANVSCYNCGLSGHYAQDCKQPSMDAGQQGGFRLKYTGPHSFEAD